jgi:hypothetical protein
MRAMNLKRASAVMALAAVALTGCEDSGVGVADGAADVRVLLTDAPADYIDAAWVDIGAISLVPMEGTPVLLSEDGTDGLVDLLELQNAATAELADMEIEPGTYAEIRMVVEAAEVDLVDGYTFRDGTTTKALKVPSGAQSGLKLKLAPRDGMGDEDDGLEIVPGENVLVVDFDVSRSFVLQGNPDTPAGIHGVIFKPTLRVTVDDVAASIAGQVTTDLDVPVAGLTVTADPVEGGSLLEAFQTEIATAVTAEDGSYTLHFLVPGSYVVSVAAPEGSEADPATREITVDVSEDATGADFVLVEPTTSG